MANGAPQVYAVVCTAPWQPGDGTTQPVGTIQNFVLWDGVTPFQPPSGTDLVLAQPGEVAYVLQQAQVAIGSQTVLETDVTPTSGQTIALPYAGGKDSLLVATINGTLATLVVRAPPLPGLGNLVQVVALGTGTITSLTLADGSGNVLKTVSNVVAPKRLLVGYTGSGWQIIPN